MAGLSEVRAAFAEFLAGELPFERCRAVCEQEDGFSPELWRAVAEGGWLEVGLGDEALPFAESVGIAEEAGKYLLPGPFSASATFVAPLLAERFPDLLDELVSGKAVIAPIVPRLRVEHGEIALALPKAVSSEGGLCLDDSFGAIPHAHVATHLLVPVEDEEGVAALALFASSQRGLTIVREPTLDLAAPTATVAFSSACAGAEVTDRDSGLRQELLAATLRYLHLLSAESVGGTEHVLGQTVSYVSGRIQFGVPVGSFQALKHALADVHVGYELGRGALYDVGSRLEADPERAAAQVLVTRLRTADAYSHACDVAIQCHGGAGFTWELGLHYWYRAAMRRRVAPVATTDLRRLLADVVPGRLQAELSGTDVPVLAHAEPAYGEAVS